MDFPELPLPMWAVGPSHWLHRTVYDDQDFYFYAADGTLLAAAGSTAIHGKKLFGMISLSAGADVLLSIPVPQPDGASKFFPTVGFEQRPGESTMQSVQKRLPIRDGQAEFAGELSWNGSTGVLYHDGGVKIGSVSLPNPLKRRFRICGPGGERLCEVSEAKSRELPAGVVIEAGTKPTVLQIAPEGFDPARNTGGEQRANLDIRLLAGLMQVIPLLND
jgi:hypothetical protein